MNKTPAPKAQRMPQAKTRKVKANNMNNMNLPNYRSNTSMSPMMVQAPGVTNNRRVLAKVITNRLSHPKLTPEGMAFLKCAFAPPDFANSSIRGVPDKFEGRSLVKKHRLISPTTVAASVDTYYILAPVPGMAFFRATVAANSPILPSTVFTGVPYSDFQQLFSLTEGRDAADIVTKFRFVSNHFELVPTVNAMTWTGNVQSWKMPLSIQVRTILGASSANNLYSVSGLNGCNSTQSDQYTGPFNLGVYTAAYSTGSQFTFNPIIENQLSLPNSIAAGDFGQLNTTQNFCIPGLDSQFDSLVVKISGVGDNATNTAIIKTWACVEYQVLPNTTLYEYTSISPCDELAIQIYKQIINELPVGVAFVDNENFWRRVLDIIRRTTGALSVIPGPYGAAFGGANAIASAIQDLTM